MHIPMEQYLLNHSKYWELRAFHSIHCMYSMIIHPQKTPVMHCVTWVHVTMHYILSWQLYWEVCYSNWGWHASRKLSVSGHMLHDTFNLLFNKESWYRKLVCKLHFILHIYI
jgi:hypothetical protein